MKTKDIVAVLLSCNQEAEPVCDVLNFELRGVLNSVTNNNGVPYFEIEPTGLIPEEDEGPVPPFEAVLRGILAGYYDGENGTAQFKSEVLDFYGKEHEQLLSGLMQQHSLDSTGRELLEEVLNEFVEQI